ncbi:hypothetical protein N8Z24_00655 [bacterium]|nr:hypothetical protein [bacterium]
MENQLVYYLSAVSFLVAAQLIILFCFPVKRLKKLNKDLQACLEDQSKLVAKKESKIMELQNQAALAKQSTPKNSRELNEFMQDIKTHGYGVVRVDPDNVFYRGR